MFPTRKANWRTDSGKEAMGEKNRGRPNRRFVGVAALAASLATTGGKPGAQISRIDPTPELLTFEEAVGAFRPFAWRTSIDFQYAAIGQSAPEIGGPEFLNRLRAEAEVKRALDRDPTLANLSAWATVLLARSNPDEAIFFLKQSLQRAHDSPQLLNDLAVAHALRYKLAARGNDFIEAVENCEAAIEVDPGYRPALFNRALLLTQLSLPSASRAWQAYLSEDPDSTWRMEAGAALRGLEETLRRPSSPEQADWEDPSQVANLVSASPQMAREGGEQLLADWARSALAGDPKLDGQTFRRLQRIAKLLSQRNSETSLQEETSLVRRLAQRPDSIATLAKAHLDFDTGLALYYQRDLAKAETRLESAADGFSTVESGWLSWAKLYLALCSYQHNDLTTAIQRLDELAARTDAGHHGALAARVQRALAISHAVLYRYSLALSHYRRAAQLYQGLGEISNYLRTKSGAAETLSLLGRWEEAWNEYLDCIMAAPQVDSVVGRREIYQGAAVTALQAGSLRWALHLQEESLQLARLSGDPENIANSLGWQSGILEQLGRREQARRNLLEAQGYIQRIPGETVRKDYQAEALLALGKIESVDDPKAGSAKLADALDLFQQTHFEARLPTVLQAQAEAFKRMGEADQAVAALQRSLDLIEQSRGSITHTPFQISFLDEQRAAFDSLVEIEFSRANTTKAFAAAERAKGRSLIDDLRRVFPEYKFTTPDPSKLGAMLDGDEALISYFLSAENLFAWRISASGTQAWKLPAKGLSDLRDQFNLAVEYRSERLLDETLKELHVRLAAPVFKGVPSGSRVIVASDSYLGGIPFAALRDPNSGRSLVEDYRISVLPSASLLPLIRRRIGELGQTAPALLAVGNPRFSRQSFPDLADLPGAANEASQAASFYGRSRTLLAETATKPEFLKLFADFEIVHFAGHAIVNNHSGDTLLLFSAPADDPDSGVLRSSELSGIVASKTRMVILSACQTAGGKVSRSEGALAIYRPFLAAGVPAVVASLWTVGDRNVVTLFRKFHVRIAEGMDPALALREAQLELLRAEAPVFDWGAFQMFGL